MRPPAGRCCRCGRLADIGATRQRNGFGPISYPNYLDIRQRAATLEGVYAYSRFAQPMTLGGLSVDAGVENVTGSVVTSNYFTVLGAKPAVGRLFAAADGEQPWASPLIVLSHRFWTRRFNRDPAGTRAASVYRCSRSSFANIRHANVAISGARSTGASRLYFPATP